MRAQLTLEFMAVFIALLLYLSSALALYSTTKAGLEKAVDKKVERYVKGWIVFMAERGEGSEIRIKAKPFPGRFLRIECTPWITLSTPTFTERLGIRGECDELEIKEEECLLIRKVEGGVRIDKC